jgi:hypothetical protein
MPSASTSAQKPSFLGFAFTIMAQMAGGFSHRQTGDGCALASAGLQVILEI